MDAKSSAEAGELSAIVHEIRERVRARHPQGAVLGEIPLADLMPLLRARDSAEGKVASIGTLNPRAPGTINAVIQKIKGLIARALDWHVREQVEFNRGVMQCVQATLEALSETNRAIAGLEGRFQELETRLVQGFEREHQGILEEARELKDIRVHWIQWREQWERKLASSEIQILRSISDLQGAWQHRVTLLEETGRRHLDSQHRDFESALKRAGEEIQQRLWADMQKVRLEYDRLIHQELRLLRQKNVVQRTGESVVERASAAEPAFPIDWLKFGERFRGSEDYVKRHLHLYSERFAGASHVLDIGCGRGELLETLRAASIPASGIDLNPHCVAVCLERNLAVEEADLFTYLAQRPDGSLGGVASLQVVEHLPPARLPEFIGLLHAKMSSGAVVALETPNPECLAIFARHFYIDPTHAKPVPAVLLSFYLEEAGFGAIEVVRLEPAIDSMPALASLPPDFRDEFFGSLDYAIFARKL